MRFPKTPILALFLSAFGLLAFSQQTLAHPNHGYHSGARIVVDLHSRSSLNYRNTYRRPGLARVYFNYDYDNRRARNLSRHLVRQSLRHQYHHGRRYNDCPYSDHYHH